MWSQVRHDKSIECVGYAGRTMTTPSHYKAHKKVQESEVVQADVSYLTTVLVPVIHGDDAFVETE